MQKTNEFKVTILEEQEQQARSVIDKMRSEELIDLMGKGAAARYVLYKGLSDN